MKEHSKNLIRLELWKINFVYLIVSIITYSVA